jgi:DNA-binding response OmpR family regulator
MSNGRLLIVDADAVARQRTCEVLEGAGFDVIAFDDGARALAFLRRDSVPALPSPAAGALARRGEQQTTLRPAAIGAADVDGLIVDWLLPGLSGGEVLARLRGDGDERPVLVTTFAAGGDDVATMLSLGADDVLVKPINARMLIARITAQLRRRRAPSLSPGELLDGRYRLLSALGESRVGVVWRARHEELDLAVDVGVVGSRGSEALRIEARRMVGMTSPGFLRLRDIARLDSSRHLVVADPLPKTTVKHLIDRGEMPVDRAFAIATSVLDVVVALHRAGLAHKNLSANSVFVEQQAGADRVVVVDGATLRLLSTAKKRVGMSSYMPPETTSLGPGLEADVYAVARLLCHLLTGFPDRLPEHAVTPALQVALSPTPSARCSARALLRAVAIAGRSRRGAGRRVKG